MTSEAGGDAAGPQAPEAASTPVDAALEQSGELKITAKEAADLVRAQTSSALLALLKKPDHVDAIGRVFAGYRVNADNLKTPLARGRLTSELVTNSKLLDAVLALPHPPAASPSQADHAALTPSKANGGKQTQHAAELPSGESDKPVELSAERSLLRQELRDARAALHALRAKDGNHHRALLAAQSEAGELRAKLAAEQVLNASRERRLKRLEREIAEARQHALALEKRPPTKARNDGGHLPGAGSSSKALDTTGPTDAALSVTLFDALERLLSRGKYEPARLLADEMLHGDPGNVDALRIRALTRLALGDRPAALHDLRAIFDGFIARHEPTFAARAMLRWMAVAGAPDSRMAQMLYAGASKESAATLAELREALAGLRSAEPEQYAVLRSWCQPALAGALFVSGDQTGDGHAQLPPQFVQLTAQALAGQPISAKRLILALDKGDEAVVHSARGALAKLDKRLQEQVLSSIAEAAGGDESYGRLLSRRTLHGSAIIDASNVANYERDLMPSARPLLANIAAVRRALRERGYFPVQTVADANLPHVIDAPQLLWEQVRRGEVELVAGGTVADETIIREAKRTGALVVSNDYMADWDPAGETRKVQYSISLTDGRAGLYE